MADVRAEILAASRSRTGWLEQVVEEKPKPFISSLKTSFEDKPQQASSPPRDIMSSPTRLEPARKLGTKVSTIANMFQALSPQKEENEQFKKTTSIKSSTVPASKPRLIQDGKDDVDNAMLQKAQPVAVLKTTAIARTESHLTRFNNARAMFENLEQKKQSLSSPKRQPSSSSSSPIHSPLHLETPSSPLPPTVSSSLESLNNRSALVNQNLNQEAVSPAPSYDSPLELTPESESGEELQNSSIREQPSNDNFMSQYDAQKNLKGSCSPPVLNGRQASNRAILTDSSKKSVDILNASLQNSHGSESDCPSLRLSPESNSSHMDISLKEEEQRVGSPEELYNNKYIKPSARNHFSGQSSSSPGQPSQYSEIRSVASSPRQSNEYNDNWQEGDTMDMESLEEHYYPEASCDTSEQHLRDSGGETLAEFECRDQELFLVEAVLNSADPQIIKNNTYTNSSVDEVELMTQEEADHLLSTSSRKSILSDDEAQEVEFLLAQDTASARNSFAHKNSEPEMTDRSERVGPKNHSSGIDSCCSSGAERSILHEEVEYHIFPDGHYFHEVAGLMDESEEEAVFYCPVPPRRKTRVRFSTGPIKVYSTHSIEDYDRHNDEVDPVSASAEYELEKRIENMDVFPVDIMKGPEGLGLSIIGMGVGADAGLEKLGIFIKTITESGAAHKDGRIRVNDQIIEVDGKSLVGVTQAYAASVLRNTTGLVKFLIGRDKEGANSEIAQLISMSLQADKEQQEQAQYDGRSGGLPPLPDPPERTDSQSSSSQSSSSSHDSTPDEGEPSMDVFDLTHESSQSYSPEATPEVLRVKVKETEVDRVEWQQQLEFLKGRLSETESTLQEARQDIVSCRQHVEQTEQQCNLLQKKYTKAKKVIRQFQQREQDFIQQQEFNMQQIQEKDQEYNALVKSLKDRIILLEKSLTDLQKQLGIPVTLPHDSTARFANTDVKTYQNSTFILTKSTKKLELEMSDPELSDTEGPKLELSPDLEDIGNKRVSTLERHHINGEFFDKAVPQTELLDTSAAKSKAELASKGSLANRQPPTIKKQCSSNSIDEMVYDEASQSPRSSFSRSPLSQPETPLESPERLENSLCFRNSWVATGTESFSSKYASDIKQGMEIAAGETPPTPSGETFLGDVPTSESREGLDSQKGQESKSAYDSQYRDSMNGPDPHSRYSGSHLPPPPPEHQPVQYHQHQQQHTSGPWQSRPVQDWSAEQVGQWLSSIGLAIHIPKFLESRITGQLLIQLDSARLKSLGVSGNTERATIKKKVKDMRMQMERERKAQEKELKAKEKQLKKHSDKIFKKK